MGVQLLQKESTFFSSVDIDLPAGSHNYTVVCVTFVWAESDTVAKTSSPTLQSTSFTQRSAQTVTDYFDGVGDVAVGVWLWTFDDPSVGSGPYTVSFGSFTGDSDFNVVFVLSNSDYKGAFSGNQATPGSSLQGYVEGAFTKQGALFLHAAGHISETDISSQDPTFTPNANGNIDSAATGFTVTGEGSAYGRLYAYLKRHTGAVHITEQTSYSLGVGSGTIWANGRLDFDTERFDQ